MATGNQRKITMNSLSHTFISTSVSSVSLIHTHTHTHKQQTAPGGLMSPGKERGAMLRCGVFLQMEGGPRAALTRCGPGLCYWVCVQWTYVASDRNMDRCLLPKWHSDKESAYQCNRWKRPGFDLWVRKIPWSKKWQPTPIFLPGKFHGQRSLAGYSQTQLSN